RMGLNVDWPSAVTVQTYDTSAHSLSPSENTSVTGGQREGLPAYSIWDVRTGDGETFVHPWCNCGKLCQWDISSSPHSLLDERRLGPEGKYWWWSDYGNKVIFEKLDTFMDYDYRL
ncbi:10040_t:CDS:2, partial [Acaulospora colombiana]